MKTINHFLLLILSVCIFTACKKEATESIDYNVLTEQRILEVSEKAIITDEDIAPLERLIAESITDLTFKQQLTDMLNSVKILKGVLPMISQLRSDPNINYNEKYKEIHNLVSQMSDRIPRKSLLIKELEDNKEGYDNEEVIFSTEFAEAVKQQWENEYKIKPIEGKSYIAYLRSDIDKIETFTFGSYTDLMKFSNLKEISIQTYTQVEAPGGSFNLNKFTDLQVLSIHLKENNKLLIDSCRNLKNVWIEGLDALERFDLSDHSDSLRAITLDNIRTLKSIILPNKKFLESYNIHIGSQDGNSIKLPSLDTLIIDANGKANDEYRDFLATIYLSNSNMKLLKLSNLINVSISGVRFIKTGTNQWGYDEGYNPTTKIENLDISNNPNLLTLTIDRINLPEPIDLSAYKSLTNLSLSNNALNASTETTYSMSSDGMSGLEHVTALGTFNLRGINFTTSFSSTLAKLENLWNVQFEETSWPENINLDLRNLKKLVILGPHSYPGDWEGAYQGPYIKKITLWKGVKDNKGPYGDTFTLLGLDEAPTQVEYVD